MTLATYSELQASIADWLNRDDLVAVIPSFIRLAETEMAGKVNHWRMDTKTTISLDGRYVALPADFQRVVRIELDGNYGRLEVMPGDQMADLRASWADRVNVPTHYCLTAGELELYPTPAQTYSAELVYRAGIPALSDAAPVNWLLTHRPAAYLYGALMQTAPYLKDDARIAVWAGLYQEALTSLSAETEAAQFSGPLRIRQI